MPSNWSSRGLPSSVKLVDVNYVIDGTGENLDLQDPTVVSYPHARSRFHKTLGRHYFKTQKHWKSTLRNIFEDDLWECEDDMHWMKDAEFQRKYRCSCPVLDKIVQKIETNDAFKRGTRGPAQMSVKHCSWCYYFISWERRVSQMLVNETNSN
eukprot:CCRYP_004401-RA/>CCRYP_004401-RA protein AED:0.50 eAED:0.57 QI:0/0/0/0.5/0/0/2/0/152